MTYIVGVDIGGTFTDCVVVGELGDITVAKAFSTPSDFSQGVTDAVRVAAEQLGLTLPEMLADVSMFLHGTSVAENAIVDGTLAPAGLLVTRGFEDTLYMTRGGYGRWSGLTEDAKKDVLAGEKPAPLIPRPLIQPIAERTDSAGRVLAVANENEIASALHTLVERGAQALGVCFLWSSRNPENEDRVRHVAQGLFPDLFFTAASELAPVDGEYERTSTVALNVRLGPIVAKYLELLEARLESEGFRGRIMVMQAHGGLLRIRDASKRAVGMIESGPVAGLIGSRAIGDLLDIPRILAADMGGTTFKVGIVRDGQIDDEREPMVLRYHYALQKMDVVSIGLAGGSIIWLDPETRLPKIGPRSAGAYPGPISYGFGGSEPTLTDVDLLLGYMESRFFLGGRARLDADTALDVFKSRIADPLDMDPFEAAGAVQRLANSMMYDLLHKQTVEKGLDPRQYALFAYGGTAGMHMPSIGPDLGVSEIVIPHTASVQGAFGLVNADVVYADVTSRAVRFSVDPEEINDIFDVLAAKVLRRLTVDNFGRDDVVLQRTVDMRYQRQVHAITTPITRVGPLTPSDLDDLTARFHALYAERYGDEAGYREAGVELIAFAVRAIVRLERPRLRNDPIEGTSPAAALVENRLAYFDPHGMIDARCYDFDLLRPGNQVEGPAIIWTPITTIVVHPGQNAVCDGRKNIVISWGKKADQVRALVTEASLAAG